MQPHTSLRITKLAPKNASVSYSFTTVSPNIPFVAAWIFIFLISQLWTVEPITQPSASNCVIIFLVKCQWFYVCIIQKLSRVSPSSPITRPLRSTVFCHSAKLWNISLDLLQETQRKNKNYSLNRFRSGFSIGKISQIINKPQNKDYSWNLDLVRACWETKPNHRLKKSRAMVSSGYILVLANGYLVRKGQSKSSTDPNLWSFFHSNPRFHTNPSTKNWWISKA